MREREGGRVRERDYKKGSRDKTLRPVLKSNVI